MAISVTVALAMPLVIVVIGSTVVADKRLLIEAEQMPVLPTPSTMTTSTSSEQQEAL